MIRSFLPCQPGAAHQHDFFGNTSTNAFSTVSSLTGKPTTCSRAGDTAAYWVPSLLNNGRRVVPGRVIAYYRTSGIRNIASIRPFPRGLKMIAGSSTATASTRSQLVSRTGTAVMASTVRRTCLVVPEHGRGHAALRVEFPNCWNGRTLDSPDHRAIWRMRGPAVPADAR
jgi:hypothetical protein